MKEGLALTIGDATGAVVAAVITAALLVAENDGLLVRGKRRVLQNLGGRCAGLSIS